MKISFFERFLTEKFVVSLNLHILLMIFVIFVTKIVVNNNHHRHHYYYLKDCKILQRVKPDRKNGFGEVSFYISKQNMYKSLIVGGRISGMFYQMGGKTPHRVKQVSISGCARGRFVSYFHGYGPDGYAFGGGWV